MSLNKIMMDRETEKKDGKRRLKMAKVKRKQSKEKGKTPGRPSLYKEEFAQQAYEVALLGGKDEEIAIILGVSVRTLNYFKKKFPEFLQSLNHGKIEADAHVVSALFKRATGFDHQAVKIFGDPKTGKELVVPYIEHVHPDVTACIFWLKNRRRKEWREKIDVMHDATAQLAERLLAARKRTAQLGRKKAEDE